MFRSSLWVSWAQSTWPGRSQRGSLAIQAAKKPGSRGGVYAPNVGERGYDERSGAQTSCEASGPVHADTRAHTLQPKRDTDPVHEPPVYREHSPSRSHFGGARPSPNGESVHRQALQGAQWQCDSVCNAYPLLNFHKRWAFRLMHTQRMRARCLGARCLGAQGCSGCGGWRYFSWCLDVGP